MHTSRASAALLVWALLATLACVYVVASPLPRDPATDGVIVEDVKHLDTIEGNRIYRVRDGGQTYNVVVRPDSIEVVRVPSR